MKAIPRAFYKAIAKQYRKSLAQDIFKLYQGEIQRGPFSGMKYTGNANISDSAHGLKIFGLYEEPILDILIKNPTRQTFIDIGAGDGYYPVGLLFSKYFQRSICFEMTSKGRDAIKKNSEINKVWERIEIHGAATKGLAKELKEMNIDFQETVVLIDIEGYEFELLDNALINQMKGGMLIIELHDGPFSNDGRRSRLIENLNATGWDTKIIEDHARNWHGIESLKQLHDLEKALLFSEGRKLLGEWLIAEPRVKMIS